MNKGKLGERIAKYYLILNGYRIIESNYRTRLGEIDLICHQDKTLVFVEVKTRSNLAGGWPEEAVTPVKLQKIFNALSEYLQTHRVSQYQIRVDVVSIEFSQYEWPKIHHLKNINLD